MKPSLLEMRHVTKIYGEGPESVRALRKIDLTIHPGELVFCVGPSGSGKSTLLHVAGGLDKPTAGEVRFGGKDIYGADENTQALWRNERVGFVFQFYYLLPEFNVLENIMMPALMKKMISKSPQKKAETLLEELHIADKISAMPGELSGGQMQRVAIARALMNEPEFIICDEPTGNLDSQTGADIIKLLVDYHIRHKRTLLIATHDQDLLQRQGRRINLKDGLIEETKVRRNKGASL